MCFNVGGIVVVFEHKASVPRWGVVMALACALKRTGSGGAACGNRIHWLRSLDFSLRSMASAHLHKVPMLVRRPYIPDHWRTGVRQYSKGNPPTALPFYDMYLDTESSSSTGDLLSQSQQPENPLRVNCLRTRYPMRSPRFGRRPRIRGHDVVN